MESRVFCVLLLLQLVELSYLFSLEYCFWLERVIAVMDWAEKDLQEGWWWKGRALLCYPGTDKLLPLSTAALLSSFLSQTAGRGRVGRGRGGRLSESPSLSMESRLQWSISSFPSSPSSPSKASIMLMILSCLALTWQKKSEDQGEQAGRHLFWLSCYCGFHLTLSSLVQLHNRGDTLLFLFRRTSLHFLLRFPTRNGSC